MCILNDFPTILFYFINLRAKNLFANVLVAISKHFFLSIEIFGLIFPTRELMRGKRTLENTLLVQKALF